MQKIKPAVEKKWLHLTAGIIWLGVGLLLLRYSIEWMIPLDWNKLPLVILSGITLAIMIHIYGFSKFAIRNIQRIHTMKGKKVCLFAFQKWTQYPLVAFMICMGIYLRIFSSLPKSLLSILYLGIGGALFSASLNYFSYFHNSYTKEHIINE